jgi:hypothetical protein
MGFLFNSILEGPFWYQNMNIKPKARTKAPDKNMYNRIVVCCPEKIIKVVTF